MKIKNATYFIFLFLSINVWAQTNPAITSWIRNTTANTGYKNITTNVQSVHYSANWAYVSTNDIPSWIPENVGDYPLIDWWPNNPWFPESMNYTFRIRLNPTPNNGTPVQTPYGHIGIWTNGVSVYNPKDAKSYNELSVWFQNAFYWEHLLSETFDPCWGHSNGSYEYHTHQSPACLYNQSDSTVHSPIVGFAFDGYPIYGAYAYTNTNGTGSIKRMESSYRLRNITDRTTLPDGTVLTPANYGPPLALVPLGGYIQDYEYVPSLGDLDDHNGRFCITPEYPSGTYAYFATLDETLTPAFPYALGEYFYGVTQGSDGNMGPSGGFVNIAETVMPYPNSALAVAAVAANIACSGGSNGAITTITTGGAAPYTYNWGGGIVTKNRTALGIGTYTVTVTDATGNTVTASAAISEPNTLTVSPTASDLSCFGSSDGAINLNLSGGTTPYSYNWGYGINSQNRTGLAAATYTVTVTDANTCTATAWATVAQPSLLSVSVSSTPASGGNNNGTANANSSGGTPPYSYLWSNGSATANINNLATGTYTVTITDANGCNAIAATNALTTAPTIGLTQHNSGSLDNGYVLFAPITSNNTYLIDKCGKQVKTWTSAYRPGQSVYLLPDGNLLRTGKTNNVNFTAGGNGGIVEKIDWNGDVIWSYTISDATKCQHHDIKPMPNGNVLVIAWEKKTVAEATAQGRNPALTAASVWSEQILELQPVGTNSANIVWEWHLWDHLVQDFDATKLNYGGILTNPQLVNLNYKATNTEQDWIHLNSVDYNPDLDQILLSSHSFGEVWIIDHSTTAAQAASHNGGNSGKGGDLLYRWGNPPAYNRTGGGASERKLWGQHNAYWIPAGYPNEHNIMIFNNGNGRIEGNYSSVDVITPPVNGYNYDAALPYAPSTLTWSYLDAIPTNFYAANISGSQQLSNGNVLICQGPSGKFFEVNPAGSTVWKYTNPVTQSGVLAQGVTPSQNLVFRCSFYAADYSGFAGHTLTAGTIIENTNSLSAYCSIITCVSPTISGNTTVCTNGIGTYSVIPPLAPATYTWSIAAGSGTIISGQGTPTIQVQWLNGTVGQVDVMVTY
jgi:hypothetical protein